MKVCHLASHDSHTVMYIAHFSAIFFRINKKKSKAVGGKGRNLT